MMEQKLNTFSNVPDIALSKISEGENPEKVNNINTNVDSDFNNTNSHTKNTIENTLNTDNTVKTSDTTKDSTNDSSFNSTQKKNQLGKLMQGNFAVDLVDMLIPSLLVLLINYIGYSIDKKDLQLSKAEKEALSPAIQDVLNEIEIDFSNPYVNLGVMLCIVYGSKVIDKLPTIKRKDKKQSSPKGMSQAVDEIVKESGEDIQEDSPLGKFQTDYNNLVEEVKNRRKRGQGDAKQYIADNFSEKLKTLAKKHGLDESIIQDKLNFKHIVKSRGTRNDKPFNLD